MTPKVNASTAPNMPTLSSRGQHEGTAKGHQAPGPHGISSSGLLVGARSAHSHGSTGWQRKGSGPPCVVCSGRRGPLTICRTSEETICMQHMAVANAHTMVDRTLRAHTLNRRSCEKRGRRRSASPCNPGGGTSALLSGSRISVTNCLHFMEALRFLIFFFPSSNLTFTCLCIEVSIETPKPRFRELPGG